MPEITTEQLAQRIYDCRLMEARELDAVFADLGSRNVPLEELVSKLTGDGLLTNWQITRLLEGHRSGFFYGNWKMLYIVGSGTFARVYRAAHVKTGDVRAVKVLRNRYSDDLETRDRFMREATTVMKLRHPNIVPIHEVENHRGRIYMVMDFIEGQNLRDFVKAQRRIKPMTSLEITRDICAGLDYAINKGVIHRDIKLSNVLLATSGRASLVDFGLAAQEEEEKAGVFNPRSVDYAGLEKATNVPRNDKRSDIYFVGVGLYHMLSGKSPLYETRERMRRMNPARYKEVEPLSSLMPELPHRVVTLVHRLMDLDPTHRVQTPKEAVQEINSVIDALKSGDMRRYDQKLSEQEAKEYADKIKKINEGRGRTLMVVESNQGVQDALRRRLKKIGYRVLIFGDPLRAMQRFNDLDPAEDLPADCVLFGCGGLGKAGLEAFNEFVDNPVGRTLPAVLMVKEENIRDYSSQVTVRDNHRVISLPIKFPVIRNALRELFNIDTPAEDIDID